MVCIHEKKSSHHDVMYKKLNPCAQPLGEEYCGRIETPKAGSLQVQKPSLKLQNV